jgi:hypothetical protein
MTDFFKGVLCGFFITLFIGSVFVVFRYFDKRDKQLFETLEAQNELRILQEDYSNRAGSDFLSQRPPA